MELKNLNNKLELNYCSEIGWEKGMTPEEYVNERPNTKQPSYLESKKDTSE